MQPEPEYERDEIKEEKNTHSLLAKAKEIITRLKMVIGYYRHKIAPE